MINKKIKTQEDLRKLHSLINQTDLQRITLVCTTITIIGTILGFVIPSKNSSLSYGQLYFYTSILLGFLIFITWLSYHLRDLQLITVLYLQNKKSNWESDYHKYNEVSNYFDKSIISYNIIFGFLWILISFYPFFHNSYSATLCFNKISANFRIILNNSANLVSFWTHYTLSAICLFLIVYYWVRGRILPKRITNIWVNLNTLWKNREKYDEVKLVEFHFLYRIILITIKKKRSQKK